jgi:hypothetical protein
LCQQLNQTQTIFPDSNLMLCFSLVSLWFPQRSGTLKLDKAKIDVKESEIESFEMINHFFGKAAGFTESPEGAGGERGLGADGPTRPKGGARPAFALLSPSPPACGYASLRPWLEGTAPGFNLFFFYWLVFEVASVYQEYHGRE